jgi:hypothetical protein
MTPDQFYPYIRVDVPDCPDPVMSANVIAACVEFCRETLAWTEFQDYLALFDGVADYEIDIPPQSRLIQVMDVWLGGARLKPVTVKDLQRVMPNWSTATSNLPVYYTAAVERGMIRLYPKPLNMSGEKMTMRVALVPTSTATNLPDFLGLHHFEAIASGVKARLMMIPSASWFNPQLAERHRQFFYDGITSARIAELHDRAPSTVNVQPRRFGF